MVLLLDEHRTGGLPDCRFFLNTSDVKLFQCPHTRSTEVQLRKCFLFTCTDSVHVAVSTYIVGSQ